MRIRMTLFIVTVLGLGSASTMSAQTVTGFKTGERTTGLTKQCLYNALGNEYTYTIGSTQLCPLNIQVRAPSSATPASPPTPESPDPRTVMAFKTGENTTGMTKQCFYNALGSEYTHTIRSTELCPLSLRAPSQRDYARRIRA